MFGLSLGLVFVPVVALIGLVAVVRSRPVIRLSAGDHARLAALQRTASRWRLVGLIVGLVGAAVCAFVVTGSSLGRLAALAPVVFVGSLLVGTIIGELTARSPQGPTRQASVIPRRVRGLPRRPWVVSAGVAGGLPGRRAVPRDGLGSTR